MLQSPYSKSLFTQEGGSLCRKFRLFCLTLNSHWMNARQRSDHEPMGCAFIARWRSYPGSVGTKGTPTISDWRMRFCIEKFFFFVFTSCGEF